MATPTEAWKASLLNLSNEDKAAHAEVINDFFAQGRLSEDTESEESVKGSLKLDLDLDSIFYNNKQNIITQNRILFCSSVLMLLGLDLCNKSLFSCYWLTLKQMFLVKTLQINHTNVWKLCGIYINTNNIVFMEFASLDSWLIIILSKTLNAIFSVSTFCNSEHSNTHNFFIFQDILKI